MDLVVDRKKRTKDYPSHDRIRENVRMLRLIADQHRKPCRCPYCASVESYSAMLKADSALLIHDRSCGPKCHHIQGVAE